MSIIQFDDTPEGRAAVEAVPAPKHVWISPRSRIVVFTGVDIPDFSSGLLILPCPNGS
jgi:hypothetical protein